MFIMGTGRITVMTTIDMLTNLWYSTQDMNECISKTFFLAEVLPIQFNEMGWNYICFVANRIMLREMIQDYDVSVKWVPCING